MGRMASWFGASTSGRNGSAHSRAQHSSSSGVPDFLAQADDPDKRRIDHAKAQSRGEVLALQSPWARWPARAAILNALMMRRPCAAEEY